MSQRRERDALVEGLHRLILASNVEILANDNHIDVVSKVGMEDVGDVAVGEHLFNLECSGIGSSHDGTRQRDWGPIEVLMFLI